MRNTVMAVVSVSILVLGLAAREGWSTPNTLVAFPGADIYGTGKVHLDVDTYSTRGVTMDFPTYWGLEFGLGKAELGFDVLAGQNAGDKPLLLNGKVLLTEDQKQGFRVVAGAFNVGQSSQPLAFNVVYVTGAKSTAVGRFHLGVMHGSKTKLTKDETALHAAFDRPLTKKWSFAVDACTGKSAIGSVNPGIYYYLTPNSDILVGWNRYNDRTLSDTLYAAYDLTW